MPTIGSSRRNRRIRYGRGVVVGFAIALAVALSTAVSPALAAGPPENDLFQNARPLTGEDVQLIDNNTGASKEPGEPNHAGKNGGASVWYSWTAPTSGNTTVRAGCFPGDIDTVLGIYTGSSVNGLTHIASNDDATCGTGSIVTFAAQAGTTYRIAVDGFSGAMGQFHFDLVVVAQCRDAIDNDGDGAVDYLYDPGCTDGQDGNEGDDLAPPAPPDVLQTVRPVADVRILVDGPNKAGQHGRTARASAQRAAESARVLIVPNCDPGRYAGKLRLLSPKRKRATGSAVLSKKKKRDRGKHFRCQHGRAHFVSNSPYFRIRPSLWKRALTAHGITLIAVIERRGDDGPVNEPLWFHKASKGSRARTPAEAKSPIGPALRMDGRTTSRVLPLITLPGRSCSPNTSGGGVEEFDYEHEWGWGVAYQNDSVQLEGFSQLWFWQGRWVQGPWFTSQISTYQARAPQGASGQGTFGTWYSATAPVVVVGGVAVGNIHPSLLWGNGYIRYSVGSRTLVQMGLYIRTARPGASVWNAWDFGWVRPFAVYTPVSALGQEGCYYP